MKIGAIDSIDSVDAGDNKVAYESIDSYNPEQNPLLSAATSGEEHSDVTPQVETKTVKVDKTRDLYIKGADQTKNSAGVYKIERGENGELNVLIDGNKKDAAQKMEEAPREDQQEQLKQQEQQKQEEKRAENQSDDKKKLKTTMNTVRVDIEIKKLKKEKQSIQRQLESVCADEATKQRLQKKLSDVEEELKIKDTDSYREKHASVSYSYDED